MRMRATANAIPWQPLIESNAALPCNDALNQCCCFCIGVNGNKMRCVQRGKQEKMCTFKILIVLIFIEILCLIVSKSNPWKPHISKNVLI